MPSVFILGAGFSKAISSEMPLMNELSNEVQRRLKDRRGRDFLPPLTNLDNVELWLTYLSQPQAWLREYHNLDNKSLYLQMTEEISTLLQEKIDRTLQNHDRPPDWLSRLVGYWHDIRATVITLNYDTLVERVLGQGPAYIYPLRLVEARTGGTIPGNRAGIDSFKLLKLHGSINWYYSGVSSFYGETIYYYDFLQWGASRVNERQSQLAVRGLLPLIVPPTSEKSTYFQHEMVRYIWSQAAQALWAATEIYCIGYSLPPTDLSIRFLLLHRELKERVPLFVVNRDEKTVDHYQELIGGAYDVKSGYTGENPLEQLALAL